MKLSNQALGTIMMALQKSLLEQSDIVPTLKELTFKLDGDELLCENPPSFKVPGTTLLTEDSKESINTTGSD